MFDPLHPCEEQIIIEDIAHALSFLCRANGHFKSFYSVGQHCLNCAREAAARGYSLRVQLGCLLHDGSEAYVSDITRPVKQVLPMYLQIEEPLQAAIWEKWLVPPLTQEETRQVFEIDDDMLLHEFLVLMDTALADHIPQLKSQPRFDFIGFAETEEAYLQKFDELLKQL
jgi:5'-deoxynucleotidase YfbR-like HD superfamily hydrolase